MSSNNFILEVAPSSNWYAAGITLDSAIIRVTDATKAINFITTSNASVPLSLSGSNATTCNVISSGITTTSLVVSSNASVSNLVVTGLLTASNISPPAAAAASYTTSNFSLHWYIASNQSFSSQWQCSNWILDSNTSMVPNTAMSNLIASCCSNVYMVTPMKGMYCMGYSDLSSVNAMRMTSWLQTGATSYCYNGGYGADERNGTMTTVSAAGQLWYACHYHASTNTLYCGPGQTYMHMTLLYPLP